MNRFLFLFLAIGFGLLQQVAAQPTPVLTTDKNRILIGEPFQVTLELKAVDRNAAVQWNLPDSLPHFEYLSADSTQVLKRILSLTSWDSGYWKLEAITATVPSSVDDKPLVLRFPLQQIRVEYDTTGSSLMNDIKPIIEVEDAGHQWVGYAVLATAILGLLFLIYVLRKRKQVVSATEPLAASAGAYEELMATLRQLQSVNWSSRVLQKQGFSELRVALQRYWERTLRQPFSTYTTDGIMVHLQPHLQREQFLSLVQVLRLTDAVTFAKFQAPVPECEQALQTLEQLIRTTNNQLQQL